jgi:putative NADPH-quinone reductase
VNIVIIEGHPDAGNGHFCDALASAYADGARASGHGVRRIVVASRRFAWLRSKAEWETEPPPEGLAEDQATIRWAEHLVLVYPLWLGAMPALLKGWLEQVLRPGFAFGTASGARWKKALKGKSARVIVTMGMPAVLYRWYFGAHSLKSLERNILGFVGVDPVRATLIGLVEGSARRRRRWLERVTELGRAAR